MASACTLLGLAAAPAPAQETTFNPSVLLGATYTDNVDYLGQQGETTSDTVTVLGVNLPLVHQMARSALRLTYNTDYILYGKASQFDGDEHRVNVDFKRTGRRRGTLEISARYFLTQEQQTFAVLPSEIVADQPVESDEVDLSLTGRTERQTLRTEASYGWNLGRRWSMKASVLAGGSTFSGGTGVEDRLWYGPALTAQNQLTRRSSLGVGYRFRRVEFDVSGEEDFQAVDVFFDHDLNRKLRLELSLGGFERSPANGESETSLFGTANLAFNDGLTLGPVRLSFGTGVRPSADGALTGSALNATANVVVSGVRTVPVNWRIGAFYNYRSPFDSGVPDTDTVAFRGAVEPQISRLVGLRIGVSYSQQTSADPNLDGFYTRAGVSAVFYPLGWSKMAGRYR